MRIAAASLLLLAGCQNSATNDPLADSRLEWRKLDDGSHYGHSGDLLSDNEYGIRCWPDGEAGFRCIKVHEFRGGGMNMTSVGLGDYPELPDLVLSAIAHNGYGCSYLVEYREEINRNGDALVSNAVGYSNPRWQRSYVNRFMDENSVEGQPYFDCLAILQAVNRGSMETLTTTEVTEGMLD